MLKKMSLKAKLVMFFLAVGVLPLAAAAGVSLWKSSQALEEKAFAQLESVRDIKKAQLNRFFEERQGDVGVLSETVAALRQEGFAKLSAIQEFKKTKLEALFEDTTLVIENFARSKDVQQLYSKLKDYHVATFVKPDGAYGVETPEYKQIWEEYGKSVKKYQEASGLCDIFIICAAHGHVMYSACKEGDLGQNLRHGELKGSGLHKALEKMIEAKGTLFPYIFKEAFFYL